MANYQKILIAIDFSDESETVMQKAIELQQQSGASISLIHVVEYTSAMYTGEIPLPVEFDMDQHLVKQAKEKLQRLIDNYELKDARSIVEMGSPKLEIVRAAEEEGVELIILGSHGKHGLQLLLGSTANGVLHKAPCDVLAVRIKHS
jgi:universal stress protein A